MQINMGDQDEFVDAVEVVGDESIEIEAVGEFLEGGGHLLKPAMVVGVVGGVPLVAYPGL